MGYGTTVTAKEMIRQIEKLLQTSEREIQFHSIVALGNIGSKKSCDIILPFLSDNEQGHRRVAIETACKIGGIEMLKT